MRSVVALITLICFISVSFADVVFLKDGKRYDGTIANREQLKANPNAHHHISILVSESGIFKRIDVEDVDYIILNEASGRVVIDISSVTPAPPSPPSASSASSPPPPRPPSPATPRVSTKNSNESTVLLVGGAAILVLGIAKKFGDAEATISENSIEYSEKTYNSANHLMWVVGGIMIFAGLIGLSRTTSSVSYNSEQFSLGLQPTSNFGSTCLGIKLRF